MEIPKGNKIIKLDSNLPFLKIGDYCVKTNWGISSPHSSYELVNDPKITWITDNDWAHRHLDLTRKLYPGMEKFKEWK